MTHHGQAFIRIIFTSPPQRVLRGSFLGTSCQSRDRVPFVYGILVNTDMGNPTTPVGMPPLSRASPKRPQGGLLVFNLFITRPRPAPFFQSQSNPKWPASWHDTPGQYIECTCKLTININIMTNNIRIFNHLSNNATIHPTYCDYAQQVLILLTGLHDETNKHDNTKTHSWSLRRSQPDNSCPTQHNDLTTILSAI